MESLPLFLGETASQHSKPTDATLTRRAQKRNGIHEQIRLSIGTVGNEHGNGYCGQAKMATVHCRKMKTKIELSF